MLRITTIAMLTVVLTGCASDVARERIARLEPGMRPVQVDAVLGSPLAVRRDGDREAWLYCIDGVLVDELVAARFEGGKLVEATRGREYDFYACDTFLEGYTLPSS
ncbi:MAG: hypothetical protein H6983_15655 [Ectothiorhodospiraceae bacterium]|nr:hypothetical protein [Ectothiorhodospiraceae bacterium]